MYLKLLANRMLHSYRLLVRTGRPLQIYPRANIFTKESKGFSTHSQAKRIEIKGAQSRFEYARRFLIDNVLKRVTCSLAADLRRKSARQLFNGNPSQFFALIGVSLASGTGILTKEIELEGVCYEIREAVCNMRKNLHEAEEYQLKDEISLESFEFGSIIAKGANAVVYEAKEKSSSSDIFSVTNTKKNDYTLAVKMMFNYDAESNSVAILRSMYREMIPLRQNSDNIKKFEWERRISERVRSLPAHANIVVMHKAFTDFIPEFPDAKNLYPDALPFRINPSGFGRNMSLFMVMKKYNTCLKQYLIDKTLNVREAILLFTQLLESIVHMNKNQIAHRDLKSDNILLDIAEDPNDCPTLVVTDFGCCLSDNQYGLVLPYKSPEIDKGGNAALMAPEVALAEPGLFSTINYSKSDLWSAGTIAYELFTKRNPFYAVRTKDGKLEYGMSNTSYTENELPTLPESVPSVISRLVYNLLSKSPSKRLDCELAATVCQLYLWAPSRWIFSEKSPSTSEILQWLLSLTTKVLYAERLSGEGGSSDNIDQLKNRRSHTEYQLITTFLQRVKFSVVCNTIHWMREY